MARKAQANHPTKAALLEAAAALLEANQPEALTVDMVCKESGVVLGSLYYHFKDLPTLVDQAMVYRFAKYVDRSIDWLNEALDGSQSKDEFFVGLRRVTRGTQAREMHAARAERAGAINRASSHAEFRLLLGAEQQRLTDELADIVKGAQSKGWVNHAIDPKASAVLIQSYTLGRSVDDITPEPMNDDEWIKLIDALVDAIFGGPAV
jgi:AcrR family transcriptional regulator